jgi:diguanylate cyclase (GGDEF)-like protein
MRTGSTSFRLQFSLLAAAVIAAVIMLLVWSVYDELTFSKDRIGISISPHELGILIEDVQAGLPADHAGVRRQDILVRLDGQEVPDLDTFNALTGQREDSSVPYQLVFLRDNEEFATELVPGTAPDIAGLLAQFILVGAYLGLAILAMRYQSRDIRARLLMIFVTLVAIELAMPTGYTLPANIFNAMLMFWLMATGAQIALELHLVSLIPERLALLKRQPRLVWLFYGIGTIVGLGLMFLGINLWLGAQPDDPDLLAQTQGIVLTLWATAVTLILIWQIRCASSARGRNQALLILIGLLPWTIYVFLSSYWPGWQDLGSRWTHNVENLVLLFFPAAIFIAIFRYGLFDVENLVRRSLVYGVISAFVIVLFYTLLTTALPWIGGHVGEDTSLWLITGVAVMTGIAFRPLRSGIERVVEKGLFPERRALRQRLIQIAGALSSESHMKDLVQRLADETRQALGLSWATVVAIDGPGRDLHTAFSEGIEPLDQRALVKMLDTDTSIFEILSRYLRPITLRRLARHQPEAARELARPGGEVLAPLYFQRRMIGILCLSSKRNGELFQREEIELLDLFSHQVAASFENLRLFQDATYEGLTGLLRREAVLRQLDTECARAARNETPLSLFMIDLDHFKVVNDLHGHLFGDQILEQVARAMQKSVRAVDSLGRYGGEEFLLVLPDTHLDGAQQVAEKLRNSVSELKFTAPQGGAVVQVTISIGISSAGPEHTDDEDLALKLLENADAAVYQAKNAGRNRVVVQNPFD